MAIAVPVTAAALSPQLQWRHPIYIAAGFAGIIAFGLLLIQPLVIGEHLPGLSGLRSRRAHRWVGGMLVGTVAFHVGALWITSPPDVIDALLFASPTPFSAWGVVAMWAVFAAALLAMLRRRLRLHPHYWRIAHSMLAAIVVVCTVVHVALIEGTMETLSKVALCLLVPIASVRAFTDLRIWPGVRRRAGK